MASGLAVLVCIAMLAGTTFAWFTHSIVNKGNKIGSGSLLINATAYDLAQDGEESFAIAKLLKVKNAGTLAAKIKLEFAVTDGGLMDALWFDFLRRTKTVLLPANLKNVP